MTLRDGWVWIVTYTASDTANGKLCGAKNEVYLTKAAAYDALGRRGYKPPVADVPHAAWQRHGARDVLLTAHVAVAPLLNTGYTGGGPNV